MNSIISHSASKVFHTGTSFLVAISTLLTSIIVFFVKNVNHRVKNIMVLTVKFNLKKATL